ncbi:MAG: PilZ domain-containing protein [Acidobacteria bacterium]|nr:PilZ domain-containing protein [Acidobacteriota bacterium]
MEDIDFSRGKDLLADKRQSQRIQQTITIQVVGMQPGSASAVAQSGQTIEVSDHGALIQTRIKYESGTELMIHNPQNLQNALFKVVWSKPSSGGSAWNTAVAYEDQTAIDFWGLH